MGANGRRAGLILVCFLLLLLPFPVRGDDEPTAEDLTRRCNYSFTGGVHGLESILTDGQMAQSAQLEPRNRLTIKAPQDMGTLILRLSKFSSAFTLTEMDEGGEVLDTRSVETDALALALPLREGCRRVQVEPVGEYLRIAEVYIFGPGPVPRDVPHPEAALDTADFLLIAAHPDDEWVFLGGVYPLYGGERGLAGTVAYVTFPSWQRGHEAIDGLCIGGVTTHPFFLGFPDIDNAAPKRLRARCPQEDVTLALVRLYRRLRPLVVVTQDPEKGEYGHWQHKLSAKAAYDAVALAADEACDPESAARYGTWTVQKLYQHFAEGMSKIELDVNAPLASYGGRTALEVAQAAYKAHRSQRRTPYRPGHSNPRKGDIVHFGLTWSTVGPDTGNDLFEHIQKADLAANRQPTPTPASPVAQDMGEVPDRAEGAATPTPTPAPPVAQDKGEVPDRAEGAATPTPTTAPTPSPSPTPIPTSTPTPGPWDRAEAGAAWASDHAAPLSAGVLLLLILAVGGKQLRRSHHRKRNP